MPRQIEFDRDEVLRRAMNVFWRQGFCATSIKDLINATDLQPGSLYGTFHNKRELFLNALEAYFSQTRRDLQSCLGGDAPPLVRLRGFFDGLVSEALQDPDNKGCLLVNTLLEGPAEDTEINQRIIDMFSEVEGEFERVLDEARRRDDLPADRNPAALARLLITGIFGLRVYHKTHPDRRQLSDIVDGLFAALGAPSNQQ